ncbi:hypothetical protein H6P81_017925 [Aristolochia fimbriata]|uniref:Uncharacterized protein n=1 Tax=Aristolochia fimbriata TaxID=158543 RepID=A0AAV7E0Z3_ARIFI|nr:hypothetical protein H6P81_017925 [Aristolochia fimbriata]
MRKAGLLRLVKPYMVVVQIYLAQKVEKHELLEMRQIADRELCDDLFISLIRFICELAKWLSFRSGLCQRCWGWSHKLQFIMGQ